MLDTFLVENICIKAANYPSFFLLLLVLQWSVGAMLLEKQFIIHTQTSTYERCRGTSISKCTIVGYAISSVTNIVKTPTS